MQSFLSKVPKFFKSKWTLGAIVLIILGVGGYFLFHKNPTYQFVTVQNGSITESVSLTGNTIPNQNVSLAFGSSGIVSHTYSDLGKQVNKGQVLAELNMSDLLAQLHNAQANYQKIINGATEPTIDVTKASVSAAEVSLDGIIKQQKLLVQNAYNNLLNSTPEALPSGG
ncbi:MAG: biotin/lipoyl-binding protein, partial [Candidatus Nomurabacteria bacterium]|nr:biotin/lipoyl-binding protein [Candidatus Nomurabacteria bacterium]